MPHEPAYGFRGVHGSGRGAPPQSAHVSTSACSLASRSSRAAAQPRVQSSSSASPSRERRSNVQKAYMSSTRATCSISPPTVRSLPARGLSSSSSESRLSSASSSARDRPSHPCIRCQASSVSGSRSLETRSSVSSSVSTADSTSSVTVIDGRLGSSTPAQARNARIVPGSRCSTTSLEPARKVHPGRSSTQARYEPSLPRSSVTA